jgi:hypothetical protein
MCWRGWYFYYVNKWPRWWYSSSCCDNESMEAVFIYFEIHNELHIYSSLHLWSCKLTRNSVNGNGKHAEYQHERRERGVYFHKTQSRAWCVVFSWRWLGWKVEKTANGKCKRHLFCRKWGHRCAVMSSSCIISLYY